jgi:hypothetical protein
MRHGLWGRKTPVPKPTPPHGVDSALQCGPLILSIRDPGQLVPPCQTIDERRRDFELLLLAAV